MIELLAFLAIFAAIPALIAQSKGRSALGFWIYGVLLLPIAIVHAALMKSNAVKGGRVACPACGEGILPQAIICPHCRTNVKEFTATKVTSG
jgi:hypothetical protein